MPFPEHKSKHMAKSKLKDHSILEFHGLWQTTIGAGGFTTLRFNPQQLAIFPRVLACADNWAHFRVRKLKFRLLPSPKDNICAAGFVGGVEDTPPATVVTLSEVLNTVFMPGQGVQTVPSSWAIPSKEELSGPLPWYKAVEGAADPTDESPGVISVCGAATDPFVLEMLFTLEFKTAVDPANTPAAVSLRRDLLVMRQERMLAREKAHLERLVGGTIAVVPVATAVRSARP